MDLKPKISKSLNQFGIVEYFLIGLRHGVAVKPASTGPVKRKSDEQPKAQKTLVILQNGFNEALPSDVSGELKSLMSRMGYVIYERRDYGKSKSKRK